MFWIIYILYRTVLLLIINKISQNELYKKNIKLLLLSVILPFAFYICLPFGGAILLGIVFYSFIFYMFTMFRFKSIIKLFPILNIIEFITVIIPSFWKFVTGSLFIPSDYKLYFLIWEIYG